MKKDKYFDEDIKIQTIIKHYILKNCLETSLSIANKNKYHPENQRKYIYIDCYAGVGLIKEKHKGSPLIACKEFQKILSKLEKINNYKIILFEKNEVHYKELLNNIKNNCQNLLKYICVINDLWTKNIHNYLEKYENDYGFIFIDPYANEYIDLQILQKIIKNNYLKEILIFINLQALRRLIGKGINNSLEIDTKDNLEEEIHKKFSFLGKEFVLFATIPTEKEGKITNSDYFGLIYMTNSANVADKFTIAYKEAFQNIKNVPEALFGNRNIQEEILEILEKYNSISLTIIVRLLQSKYLSWKKTLKIEEIPTLNKILFVTSPFFDKRIKKVKKLKKEAIKSNQNLKQTIISLSKL